MSGISTRSVAPSEVEEFLDWFERYWAELETFMTIPDPLSRDEYRHLLETARDHIFWWAEEDGRRVGFCVFTIGPHWYRRDLLDGYIDEFYIVPEARRRGAGRQLAGAMLAEFRRRGVRVIELSVLNGNERAQAFWRSLGFGTEMLKLAMPGSGG